MYSVKRNGEVIALFMEESDAEEFRSWKVTKCWNELFDSRIAEYGDVPGVEDVSDDVFAMISGMVEVEANKTYCVVAE